MFILFFVSYFMFYDSALAHQVVEIRPALAETAEGGMSNFHYLAQYKLETALPPIAGQPSPSEGFPQYINYLFIFGLGLITVLALAQMMIGGIQYILAAGNVANKVDAKDTIKQALIGLGLLLVSYLLLNTINPDLVNLRNPNLTPTEFKGTKQCVEWNAEGLQACMDQGGSSWEECQAAACIKEIDTSVSDWSKNYGGSSPTANAEAGKPCSPNGDVSMPGLLVCQNGQWTVQVLP